jgi:hypothetical protein
LLDHGLEVQHLGVEVLHFPMPHLDQFTLLSTNTLQREDLGLKRLNVQSMLLTLRIELLDLHLLLQQLRLQQGILALQLPHQLLHAKSHLILLHRNRLTRCHLTMRLLTNQRVVELEYLALQLLHLHQQLRVDSLAITKR